MKKLSIDNICTAFVATYESGFAFPGESHDMWELDCVLEGQVGITSGAHVYTCGPGDVILHRAEVFHSVWVTGPYARIMTVSFRGQNLAQCVPWGKFQLNEEEQLLVTLLKMLLLDRYGGCFRADRDESRWLPLQQLTNLLENLSLSLGSRRESRTIAESDRDAALFSQIVHHLRDHVCDALGTEDLCQQFGIGKTALKALFKRYTGGGVMGYYNDLRMRHAIKLLSGGHTMAEIASTMHFSSQNYFSSFFRRMTGKSPIQYRRELQAGDGVGAGLR